MKIVDFTDDSLEKKDLKLGFDMIASAIAPSCGVPVEKAGKHFFASNEFVMGLLYMADIMLRSSNMSVFITDGKTRKELSATMQLIKMHHGEKLAKNGIAAMTL